MNLREFLRFHLLKALLGLVAIQIIIVAIVQNYNHRPVALRDIAMMIESRTIKITPLTNDTDKDETDELSVSQVGKPLHGKVEQKGNIVFYTPDAGFVGTDSMTYIASDGKKESQPAYIAVQVNKNLEPVAVRDEIEAYAKGSIVVDVLKNDSDREGDSIFISSFSQPQNGQVELINNQLVYTAKNTTAKADSFKYVLSDGMNLGDSTTVAIALNPTSDPRYPWLWTNVGDVAIPGSLKYTSGKFEIQASGSDIWNSTDGMLYASQYVSGNCEMVTKVESLEGTNDWAKAGLMVRESLSGGSRCAFVCVTTKNGGVYHWRPGFFEQMQGSSTTPGIAAPYWVKINRTGNLFSFFISPDGSNWNKLGENEVEMKPDVYIGFGLTSHNNEELAKAIFSNFKLTAKTTSF